MHIKIIFLYKSIEMGKHLMILFLIMINFEKIISIEIEPAIHQTATDNFKDHNNVEILLGDSSKVLPDRLESITDNTLFWLDAHFPGADAGLVSYESCKQIEYDTRVPLEAELTAIAKRVKTYKDVIIADDLWLYEEGSFGGGNMNDHARQHNQNITVSLFRQVKLNLILFYLLNLLLQFYYRRQLNLQSLLNQLIHDFLLQDFVDLEIWLHYTFLDPIFF